MARGAACSSFDRHSTQPGVRVNIARPLTYHPFLSPSSVPPPTPTRGGHVGPSAGGSEGAAEGGACQQVVMVDGLNSETVIGIAFASFVIGVGLTASIWFIYVKTGQSAGIGSS